MDKTQEEVPATDQNIAPAAPVKNNINLWMVVSIILLIILVGSGAFLLGRNGTFSGQNPLSQNTAVTVSPSSQPAVIPSPTVMPKPTASQVLPTGTATTSDSGTKVSAGGFGSFPKYTLIVSAGWQNEKTVNNFQDLLTISSGKYQIQINQTGMGNGECSYPGATPEPMSQQFTAFVPLAYNGDPTYYRRSKSQIPYPNGEDQYAICQKNSSNSYSFVTKFGSVLYMAPTTPDQKTLLLMDQMVQSIQKQ